MEHALGGEQRQAILRAVEFPSPPFGTLVSLSEALQVQWQIEVERVFEPEIECRRADALGVFLEAWLTSWDAILECYATYYGELLSLRARFTSQAAKLHGMAVLGPDSRPKHFVSSATGPDEVARLVSKDRESRFYGTITLLQLRYLLQDCLSQRFNSIWPPPPYAQFDIDSLHKIGVSLRGETTVVRFKCDFFDTSSPWFPSARV
jgi:hypothetical protein